MSDYSVYLDPRVPPPVRLPDPVLFTAPVDSSSPAPTAAIDARSAAQPPAAVLATPPAPERLRPQVLTAEATASSLATRQSSYAEIDRHLAATSTALRRATPPVDVRGTLAELGARVEARRAEESRAISESIQRVNELSAQVARTQSDRVSGADAAYGRDANIRALARLTGANVAPGAPEHGAPVNLEINGYPLVKDGQAVTLGLGQDDAGRLIVTGPDGAQVPVDSGVVGGRLQLVNDVLPQVIRGVTALSAVIGGVAEAEAPGAAGTAIDAVAAQARAGQVVPAVAAFLNSVRTGGAAAPVSLVSGYLGAVDAGDGARRSAVVSALQQLNQLTTRLGSAAEAVAAEAANTTPGIVSSSAPDLATAVISGKAELGSVSFAVLSAAGPAGIVSDQEYIPGQPLHGDEPFRFGILTMDETGAQTQQVYDMVPRATISDVVATINNSNAGVRATLSTLAAGTVQLSVISLRTGRFSELTVANGQQPPAASTILGRFNRLMEARDTVLRVDTGPQAGSVAISTSPNVSGLMEGVTVSVQQADPAKVVTLTTAPDPRALAHKVDTMVNSAAGVLAGVWQATQAGTPLAGDRMLADMAGRIMSAVTGVAPVRGMPGLGLRGGGMSFDRDAFLRAFTKDPLGTEASVASVAGRMVTVATNAADPVAGYLAMRLAATQDLRQGYGASKAAPDERLTSRQHSLKRRESALESLLGHLHDEANWLRDQLGAHDAAQAGPVRAPAGRGAERAGGDGVEAVAAGVGAGVGAGAGAGVDAVTQPLPRVASAAGLEASADAQAGAVGALTELGSLLGHGTRGMPDAQPA